MRTIIATIKPYHLGNIRRGEKLFEVRKTAPESQFPVKVLLCESGSGGQIKAEFTMHHPERLFANEVKSGSERFRELTRKACVTEPEAFLYLGNAKQLFFWDINDMIDYCSTKCYKIRNISEFGLKRPPQSWQYVDENWSNE